MNIWNQKLKKKNFSKMTNLTLTFQIILTYYVTAQRCFSLLLCYWDTKLQYFSCIDWNIQLIIAFRDNRGPGAPSAPKTVTKRSRTKHSSWACLLPVPVLVMEVICDCAAHWQLSSFSEKCFSGLCSLSVDFTAFSLLIIGTSDIYQAHS